tara:strand:- start:33 stop:497 length:465 start_codon:yes stop_codon:yes gene_type:complete
MKIKNVKNILVYIFIYIFIIGCENNITGLDNECFDCTLNIEPSWSNLQIDDNGYYHLNFENDKIQTITQLKAYVGYGDEYVGWTSDTYFDGCIWNYCEDVPIVNGSSYSNGDGYVYTMLGVYEGNIGDTAKVWCGYWDNYGKQWLDSLEVIIDE